MDRTRLFREHREKETHVETQCTSIRYDSDRGIYGEIWGETCILIVRSPDVCTRIFSARV